MGELDEIRELLLKVIDRLDSLEKRLNKLEADEKLIESYKSLLRSYATVLGSVARIERLAQHVVNDIDRAIVRSLASKGPMNISQITEEVKRIRGSASRRIISKRLLALERKGLVERVSGGGRGKVYKLRSEVY